MRKNISNQFERNLKLKHFSIVKSIEFYSFDVKAIVTKKLRVAFCDKKEVFSFLLLVFI